MTIKKNTAVFIITHKEITDNPVTLKGYHYLAVGSNPLPYKYKDNEGENISKKNPFYCEETGLYWMWKNYSCDNIGLVHYRRFFVSGLVLYRPVKETKINKILSEYDICLEEKEDLAEIAMNHFARGVGDKSYLLRACKIITDKDSSYKDAVDTVLNSRMLSMRNMFITKKETMDKYCSWVFDVLFSLESSLKEDNIEIPPRLFGFITEELLNVWVIRNNLKVKYLRVINPETDCTNIFTRTVRHFQRKLHK